ncbi:MAG: choline-sulfatase, partial [Pirellulales bacterium]|nr:choline-sulfatase [Pirellulales bacterium]
MYRCTLLLVCCFSGLIWNHSSSCSAAQPNVVMICIDDLNDWTGFLGGHPDVSTPNMDELAERGRNFSNA